MVLPRTGDDELLLVAAAVLTDAFARAEDLVFAEGLLAADFDAFDGAAVTRSLAFADDFVVADEDRVRVGSTLPEVLAGRAAALTDDFTADFGAALAAGRLEAAALAVADLPATVLAALGCADLGFVALECADLDFTDLEAAGAFEDREVADFAEADFVADAVDLEVFAAADVDLVGMAHSLVDPGGDGPHGARITKLHAEVHPHDGLQIKKAAETRSCVDGSDRN